MSEGDRVVLNSGGPIMEIISISDDFARCAFGDKVLIFNMAMLTPVSPYRKRHLRVVI